MSVGMQLVAYGGRDDKLFRGAIMESANPVYYGTLGGYNTSFFGVASAALGCNNAPDQIQCLRTVRHTKVRAFAHGIGSNLTWQPIVDGDIVRKYGSEQLKKGEFVHVPIITGANSDEGISFAPTPIADDDAFLASVKNNPSWQDYYPMPAAAVAKVAKAYPAFNTKGLIPDGAVPTSLPMSSVYPVAKYGSSPAYRRIAQYYGDVQIIAHRRLTCETWTSFHVPAYCFRFDTIPLSGSPFTGVEHAVELPFVFNNKVGAGLEAPPFKGAKNYAALSDQMSTEWVTFVNDLKPGIPWPTYGEGVNHVFDANKTGLGYLEKDDFRKEAIALLNSFNADIYLR